MASLWRASSRILSRAAGNRAAAPAVRCVSTSDGKKDLIDEEITTHPIQEPRRVALTPEAKEKLRGEVNTEQWQSFGFDVKDQAQDRRDMHIVFFWTVGVSLVLGGFIWAYMPDPRNLDWAHREAFLQLHERESKGLPLVDPNLIDPANITLPTDEELGDQPILI